MQMKGVLYGAELDEFTVETVTENNQQKTKATIKVSFPGGFNKSLNNGQGGKEYCRLRCSTTGNYLLERLQALNIPQGKQPNNTQKPQLIIPFKNLYWTLWNGNSGPGTTGYCDIDGEVAWCQSAPRPQKQNGNGGNGGGQGQWNNGGNGNQGNQGNQGQWNNGGGNGGGQGNFQPQFQNQGGQGGNGQGGNGGGNFQPQFQQNNAGQGNFQTNNQGGGNGGGQGNMQFQTQNPPGFQGQQNNGGAAPYQQGQPFPQPQFNNQGGGQGGHDPFTVPQ